MTGGVVRPAPVVGVGRSLGFALAALPWPGGVVTRATLTALIPEHLAVANATPLNVTVKAWLRRQNGAGRIRRGAHIVQPLDPAALLAGATRGVEGWTAADFVDIKRAVRCAAGRAEHIDAPRAVAERVDAEIAWLEALDVSALPAF